MNRSREIFATPGFMIGDLERRRFFGVFCRKSGEDDEVGFDRQPVFGG